MGYPLSREVGWMELGRLLWVCVLCLGWMGVARAEPSVTYVDRGLPTTLNPLFAKTMVDHRVHQLLFDRLLFRHNITAERPTRLVRDVWRIEGGWKVALTLEEGLSWHDGAPLRLEDVCFTVNALIDPGTDSQVADRYKGVLAGCEVVDGTAIISFTRRFYNAERQLDFFVLPAHAFEGTAVTADHGFARAPIGTGPMRFEREVVRARRVVGLELVAYDGGLHCAKIGKITLREPATDPRDDVESLLAGAIDGMIFIPPSQRSRVRASEDVGLVTYDTRTWWFAALNTQTPPLADPRVREALERALDRNGILEEIVGDDRFSWELVSGPSVQSAPGYNRGVATRAAADLAGAVASMEAAGAERIEGTWHWEGVPILLTLGIDGAIAHELEYGLLDRLAVMLRDAGFAVQPFDPAHRLDPDRWRAALAGELSDEFDILVGRWFAAIDGEFGSLYHTRTEGRGAHNLFGWSDPRTDRLLLEHRRAVGYDEASDAHRAFHAHLSEARPHLFLWNLSSRSGWKSAVSGIRTPGTYFQEFAGWRLRDSEPRAQTCPVRARAEPPVVSASEPDRPSPRLALKRLDLSETPVTDAGMAILADLVDLRSLVLAGTGITDAGLEALRRQEQLRSLELSGTAVTGAGLAQLSTLEHLATLDLGRTDVDDAGLVHLAGLPLTHLDLTDTTVGDRGLEHLSRVTRLARLDLGGTRTTDGGLVHLAGLHFLDGLDLSETRVTDAGLDHLPGLAWLDLDGTAVTEASLASLSRLPGLSFLDLTGITLTADGMGQLSGLHSLDLTATQAREGLGALDWLRELRVEGSLDDEGLASISELRRLEVLDLSGTGVTDAGLVHLTGLRKLRRVVLADTSVTDAGLGYLVGLPALTHLVLADTRVTEEGLSRLPGSTVRLLDLGDTRVTEAGLAHLARHAELYKLVLTGARVRDRDLAGLSGSSLSSLDLSGTRVTDAGLVHLAELPYLKSLALSDTRVTDAGLVHLAELTGLRELDLSGTRVTDEGVARIGRLENLWRLSLRDTAVTGTALAHLVGNAALGNLDLGGTSITDADLARLQGTGALP